MYTGQWQLLSSVILQVKNCRWSRILLAVVDVVWGACIQPDPSIRTTAKRSFYGWEAKHFMWKCGRGDRVSRQHRVPSPSKENIMMGSRMSIIEQHYTKHSLYFRDPSPRNLDIYLLHELPPRLLFVLVLMLCLFKGTRKLWALMPTPWDPRTLLRSWLYLLPRSQ